MVRSSSRPSGGYGTLDDPTSQHPRPQPESHHSYRNKSLEGSDPISRPSKISGVVVERTPSRSQSLWKSAVVFSLVIGAVATVTWVVGSSDDSLAGRYPRSAESNFAEKPLSDRTATTADSTSVLQAGKSSPPSTLAEPLEFSALNFYHVRDGKPGQDYPWLKDIKLVEPYRETTLAVTNALDGFEYRWTIRPEYGDESAVMEVSGVKAVIVLKKLDGHVISLEEIDSAGKVMRRLDETVIVKYVRREIRTLTDSEREELLDAVRCVCVYQGYQIYLNHDVFKNRV